MLWSKIKFPFLSPDDGGLGGGTDDTGTDNSTSTDDSATTDEPSGDVNAQLEFYKNGYNTLANRNEELVRQLFNTGAATRQNQQVQEPEPDPEPKPVDLGIDLSGFDDSQKAVVKLITEKILPKYEKSYTDEIKALKGELNQTKVKQQDNEATSQIKETQSKYPDFWNFRAQMLKLADTYKTASAEDLYLLAKAKVVGFNKQQKQQNTGGQGQGQGQGSGQVRTEKPGMSGNSATKGRTTTMREAMEQAWNDEGSSALRSKLSQN